MGFHYIHVTVPINEGFHLVHVPVVHIYYGVITFITILTIIIVLVLRHEDGCLLGCCAV
jgi:hypothetical protein